MADQLLRVAVLCVNAADADLAADRMWTAGAQAVEERAIEGVIEGDVDGRVGDRVEVLSVLGDHDEAVIARLGDLPTGWSLRFEEVDPTPAETWREFANVVHVEPDVALRPAWLDPVGARFEVAVEPAGSFGLGDHPTTRLCAAAIRRLIKGGEAVLDVGCGSGVLSVLAVMCGAASAVGTDIAELAITATTANAVRNGVGNRVTASTQTLDEIEGVFDLVVANILAPTLRSMADDLREHMAPNGVLVLSGLLDGGYESVVRALDPLRVDQVDTLDGWAAVTLRHP